MTLKSGKNPNKILLVEGVDDFHVVCAILKKYQIPETFSVENTEGVEKLFEQIPTRLLQSEIQTLGILIGADTNLKKRWKQLKTKLPNLPEKPNPSGTIFTQGEIKVGIWLMPDNNLDGMLEDFICSLVPADDKLMPFVEETLQNLKDKKLQNFKEIHCSKAKIHTWLAWQKTPGTPLGLAITKKYLDEKNNKCLPFLEWLKNLFTK
ncbi:hypothetical protein IT568_07010 [bacterium]|nr:hypothetical protein [bacterium]